ncbi:hypothetical protein [Silvanigrella aquatica]|uniref:Follicular epithelium yolk protein subunit n=1 Tax=Silvanigrella aquatica TaxID=1915309 RepID=A0A1L4D049_9BACT|nr:hypothetical protein [Silvanigrella aquatica]APJ03582.1 follicular epithelium yolk protein subunit [Silvanigrella aquatica]
MSISVRIRAGSNMQNSSVYAEGSEFHIITDSERYSFNIGSDADLKNAVGKYFGKNPNDAYLHSPTPWGDLYKTYGWPQTQTNLTVASSTIAEITSEPSIVKTQTFKNNSSVAGTFDVSISEEVSNTVESNWNNSSSVSFGQSISYNVSFLGTGGGGETSFGFEQTWGKGGSNSKSVTVGSSSGVTVLLQPGESVKSILTATRGYMNVRLVYRANLSGTCAVNYNPTFQGHHFWGLGINNVVNAAGSSNNVQIVEDIKIGYYSDSELILEDLNGNRRIYHFAIPGMPPAGKSAPTSSREATL